METKELKIQIPEGYEIDKEKSTFEKIVFKKKDTKPRSWEEFCDQPQCVHRYYIGPNSYIIESDYQEGQLDSRYDKNVLPTKELTEAFLAMMQLMSLRQAWIGDWKPDWNKNNEKYCVCQSENIIRVYNFFIANRTLSFPTREMATDFMNTFKDLLEIAKPLI